MAPSIYSHSAGPPLDTSLSSMKGLRPLLVQEQRGRRTRTGVTRGLLQCPAPWAAGLPILAALLRRTWESGRGLLDPRPGAAMQVSILRCWAGCLASHTCRALGFSLSRKCWRTFLGPLEVTGTQGKRGRVPGKSQGHEGWGEGLLPVVWEVVRSAWPCGGDGGCAKLSMLAVGSGKPHKEFDFVPEGFWGTTGGGQRERPQQAGCIGHCDWDMPEAQHVPGSSGQCP